ncbi:glycosyltransferase family 41 protein [Mixia osmundae IAM 14324]|uniref:protein O-GlcNAc transferase n=1 Tax=Mixia osmundae (strain CBS 9802 / IAM 14324 / JCM 22182 / KY 12970) TaxID=764103 RepID=G7E1P0_MIXOS|nr:glycosyltransferase family 41 protein [Mixia osmundae IAM 14324]KEI36700.1 glycosyltransferase family 41 protein [Mixia osmundae IAM 14324]GAA96750.1 hypothetical protein E5Q_03421 [Mixia osmundae IAM 14324]
MSYETGHHYVDPRRQGRSFVAQSHDGDVQASQRRSSQDLSTWHHEPSDRALAHHQHAQQQQYVGARPSNGHSNGLDPIQTTLDGHAQPDAHWAHNGRHEWSSAQRNGHYSPASATRSHQQVPTNGFAKQDASGATYQPVPKDFQNDAVQSRQRAYSATANRSQADLRAQWDAYYQQGGSAHSRQAYLSNGHTYHQGAMQQHHPLVNPPEGYYPSLPQPSLAKSPQGANGHGPAYPPHQAHYDAVAMDHQQTSPTMQGDHPGVYGLQPYAAPYGYHRGRQASDPAHFGNTDPYTQQLRYAQQQQEQQRQAYYAQDGQYAGSNLRRTASNGSPSTSPVSARSRSFSARATPRQSPAQSNAIPARPDKLTMKDIPEAFRNGYGDSHQRRRTQTDDQIHSILTLPPTLLAQLARTSNPEDQMKLAVQSRQDKSLLQALAIPPPSPSAFPATFESTKVIKSHPSMALLLHQAVAPSEHSLTALAPQEMAKPFVPIYTSVDSWAEQEARQQLKEQTSFYNKPALKPDQVQEIAMQIKKMHVQQQEKEVNQEITNSKHQAISLATQAASAEHMASSGSRPSVDLSIYADHYRRELDRNATGYYLHLHKDALARLLQAEVPATSSPEAAHAGVDETRQAAMRVQAAAAAAITANVMAAHDLARSASQSLVQTQQRSDQQKSHSPEVANENGSATQAQARNAFEAAQRASAPAEVTETLKDLFYKDLVTAEHRDYLLRYAHQVYTEDANNEQLLPLLHMLQSTHPTHCPTLLLLSCVYYSKGASNRDYLKSSIHWNEAILKVDSQYVEAMSNIGTTLRALGHCAQAEQWWWKAIKLRPMYCDAFDNLLSVLCTAQPSQTSTKGESIAATPPRHEEAIQLCDFVEQRIFYADDAKVKPKRPLITPAYIPASNVHRFQTLFNAKANLWANLGRADKARCNYEKGIEIALARGPSILGFDVRDFMLASCLASLCLMREALGEDALMCMNTIDQELGLSHHGKFYWQDLLTSVSRQSDNVAAALLRQGGGFLPMTLLTPELIARLPSHLFASTGGILPSLYSQNGTTSSLAQTNQTTSTLLLTLAKIFQDGIGSPNVTVAAVEGIPLSPSMLLPLYYSALALHPTPSTYNNLGILLASLTASTTVLTPDGAKSMSGQDFALLFYETGLKLDPSHPHLYTNLGSLLKDMGSLQEAVQMYEKAVDCNPNFDVALANLANAVKDLGHVQESVPYYKRAVQLNPDFPEAVCGLANALCAICDWQNRGSGSLEIGVGSEGQILRPGNASDAILAAQGWMAKIRSLVQKQLSDGLAYGSGMIANTQPIEGWLAVVAQALATGGILDNTQAWTDRLSQFYEKLDRWALLINEGGFIIRLIEHLSRRVQRRWYLHQYGSLVKSDAPMSAIDLSDPAVVAQYKRPLLPPQLTATAVPTVLPFHTFTYPLDAREIRLISHRNALRISMSALSQPWMPTHVYPPPPPPSPKINIGYVSSDFNNHPLSHLMQSIFGMHDLDRFNVFLYATTASDQSQYRKKISAESQCFRDVSAMRNAEIIQTIINDKIHILVNLNGYTKGARNEIFAARPCPIQVAYMGFVGTLAASWCDWLIADEIVCPPDMVSCNVWRKRQELDASSITRPTELPGDLDPEENDASWVYTEKLCYMPHSYFVADHAQSAPREPHELLPNLEERWAEEERCRWRMRQALFPELAPETVIFANFNQLYKIDPSTFCIWLKILQAVPNSVLWLLRFPAAGEPNLLDTAKRWGGEAIAKRILFTSVASKDEHLNRGRVADLFIDTLELGSHTTCVDVLWSGSPIVVSPRKREKMGSRVSTSIVTASGFADALVVEDEAQYERRAAELGNGLKYTLDPADPSIRRGSGELNELRRKLFLSRETSPIYDTRRWVRNLETGLEEMWSRYVTGLEMEDTGEWKKHSEETRRSGCIHIVEK